jgi:hypothetical protein
MKNIGTPGTNRPENLIYFEFDTEVENSQIEKLGIRNYMDETL